MKPNESPAESAPEAASPFPPAFRWEVSPPEAPTQVIAAVGRDTTGSDAGTAAQVVSYQQRPNQAGDLFQPMGKPADTHSGGAFTKPGDSSAPPWADAQPSFTEQPVTEQPIAEQPIAEQPIAEQPIAEQPIAEQPIAEQQSSWMRQGPEVFETPPRQSWPKQIIGIAVLAIIVLGLVGATVAYFLTAGSPDRSTSAASQPTETVRDLPAPPAALPAPADTASALIEPVPGQVRSGGGPFDLPQLKSRNLLPPPILNALQAGRMIDGVLKTTTAGGTTIGMFALTMPDQPAATTVVRTIVAVQHDGGLLADNDRALQGVAVLGSAPGPPSTVYRVAYVLYNRAIYFEVFGPNRDAVLKTVDYLINLQVAHAPPTVRGG